MCPQWGLPGLRSGRPASGRICCVALLWSFQQPIWSGRTASRLVALGRRDFRAPSVPEGPTGGPVSARGAADQFWRELQGLYHAAGRPTLKRLVHLGLEQCPQISISHSTINSWLNRQAVPTGQKNERYLAAMVAFLQARVKSDTGYEPLPTGGWGRLLHEAQAERAAGKKNGRPRRSALSSRAVDSYERWRAVTTDPALSRPSASASPAGYAQPAKPVLWQPEGAAVFTSHNVVLTRPPPGVLVGRDSEVAMLAGLVTGIAAGRGSAVLVEGEPGIGKSTLVRAALAEAASLGCRVFWGTGDELGQALPLQPLLDGLCVRLPSANPRRHMIVRLLRGEVAADSGTDWSAVLAEQLLAVIAEQCATQPTILVIDDLQWADQASIRLWCQLARSARWAPLLLVGMTRPVPQRDDLLALRRAAGDAQLQLAGLTMAATAELVAALAGGEPADALLRLADDAAGNPLYITELVATLRRSSKLTITGAGAARLTSGSAPISLSAAIVDRLGFVPGSVREVLRAAALLGVEFAVPDLAVVLGRSVAELVPAVDEACAAGVLAESGSSLGFRHPVIRAALYGEIPAPLRAAWHRDAARSLAEAGAPADRVARQLLGAVSGGDGTTDPMDDWILGWLTQTAELLVRQAPRAGAELLQHAVASCPAGSPQHDLLVSRLADALYRVGD